VASIRVQAGGGTESYPHVDAGHLPKFTEEIPTAAERATRPASTAAPASRHGEHGLAIAQLARSPSRQRVNYTGCVEELSSAAGESARMGHRATLRYCFYWRPQGDSNPCYRRERAMSWASRRWGRTWAPAGAQRPLGTRRRPARAGRGRLHGWRLADNVCAGKDQTVCVMLVEPGGIEPPTSCMPCKRSPS
jgi:hypothetical protein